MPGSRRFRWRPDSNSPASGKPGAVHATYRLVLQEVTRKQAPLDWAAAQSDLGNALLTLGEREGRTALLREAVGAYRAALEVRVRRTLPWEWALTQNNLGNAFLSLGRQERSVAKLAEAMAAYRAALEERTCERAPLEWARTKGNLARAEEAWGDLTHDPARWRVALQHAEAALEEYIRAGSDYDVERITRLRDRLCASLDPSGPAT